MREASSSSSASTQSTGTVSAQMHRMGEYGNGGQEEAEASKSSWNLVEVRVRTRSNVDDDINRVQVRNFVPGSLAGARYFEYLF
jgi:hypothetical protein